MKVLRLDKATSDSYTVAEDEMDELDVAIAHLADVRVKRDRAEKVFQNAQDAVLALLDERQEKSHWSPLNNGLTATMVQREMVKIDEEALYNKIANEEIWHKVTVMKVDQRKLEQAIAMQIVPLDVVNECSTVKPSKPYVRLSEHREQESEEPG